MEGKPEAGRTILPDGQTKQILTHTISTASLQSGKTEGKRIESASGTSSSSLDRAQNPLRIFTCISLDAHQTNKLDLLLKDVLLPYGQKSCRKTSRFRQLFLWFRVLFGLIFRPASFCRIGAAEYFGLTKTRKIKGKTKLNFGSLNTIGIIGYLF